MSVITNGQKNEKCENKHTIWLKLFLMIFFCTPTFFLPPSLFFFKFLMIFYYPNFFFRLFLMGFFTPTFFSTFCMSFFTAYFRWMGMRGRGRVALSFVAQALKWELVIIHTHTKKIVTHTSFCIKKS